MVGHAFDFIMKFCFYQLRKITKTEISGFFEVLMAFNVLIIYQFYSAANNKTMTKKQHSSSILNLTSSNITLIITILDRIETRCF